MARRTAKKKATKRKAAKRKTTRTKAKAATTKAKQVARTAHQLYEEKLELKEFTEKELDAEVETLPLFKQPSPRSKLTLRNIARFCKYTRLGHAPSTVCAFLGISNAAYWEWITRGMKYLDAGDEVDEADAPYAHFVVLFRKSLAFQIMRLERRVRSPINNQWRRELALLERLDPDTYAPRSDSDMGDEVGYDPDESFL